MIEFKHGALCDTYEEQANAQGYFDHLIKEAMI